jgi:cell division protein FtsA
VVITGGASQMDGVIEITSKIIEKRARLGKSSVIQGIPDNMRSSSFSAINSLLTYSIINNNDISTKNNIKSNNSEGLYSYLIKFKNWILENF